ncbi:hypothetical protein JCM21900_002396 [Sporobolomyces salmonicolor]
MLRLTFFLAFVCALATFVAAAPLPTPTPAPHLVERATKKKTTITTKKKTTTTTKKKTTTTTKKKTTTTTKKAAATAVKLATTTSYKGQGTWYTQNGVSGSCGQVHKDSDLIVAMNSAQVADGAHCGQYVTVTNLANSKTVRALVADECPGCSYGSLDLSVGAFQKIGALSTGVLSVSWSFS